MPPSANTPVFQANPDLMQPPGCVPFSGAMFRRLDVGLYLIRVRCGGRTTTRTVWGVSDRNAQRRLTETPSLYGLPHERVEILACRRLDLAESAID